MAARTATICMLCVDVSNLPVNRAHGGDDIRLHNPFHRRDSLQDRLACIVVAVAVELGDDLLFRQHYDVGEVAVYKFDPLQRIHDLGWIGRSQQFDKEIDIDHLLISVLRFREGARFERISATCEARQRLHTVALHLVAIPVSRLGWNPVQSRVSSSMSAYGT